MGPTHPGRRAGRGSVQGWVPGILLGVLWEGGREGAGAWAVCTQLVGGLEGGAEKNEAGALELRGQGQE